MPYCQPNFGIKILILIALITTSCNKLTRVLSMRQSLPAIYDAQTSVDDQGITSATVVHTGETNIRVKAKEGHGIDGAAVIFPVGSLASTAKISLRHGEDLSQSDFALAMNLGTTFIDRQNSLEIMSDQQKDLRSPMQIQLKLPEENSKNLYAKLFGSTNLAVVFQSFYADAAGTYRSGILSSKDFTIEDDKIIVQAKYFGIYQIVETQDAISSSIELPGTVTAIIEQFLKNKIAIESDTTKPYVTQISSLTPNGTFAAGHSIEIKVSFSEAVILDGVATLALNSGGIATYLSGSGSSDLVFSYTVASSESTSDLDVASDNSLLVSRNIADVAGNAALLILPFGSANGSLANFANLVVAGSAARVLYVTSSAANGSYNSGDSINVSIAFSSAVTVSGTPKLTLETGSIDTEISYASGSGTAVLVFSYTVGANNESADLDYVSTSSLNLNGGQILTSSNSVSATLLLPSPGSANSIAGLKAIVIDNTAPSVTITSTHTVGLPTNNPAITLNIVFSEPVTGFTSADISVANATKGTLTSLSNTSYTLSITATGATVTADIAAGIAIDLAENQNTLAGQWAIIYDNIVPTVSITSNRGSGPTNQSSATLTFTFSEPVIGFDINDVTISGATKGTFTANATNVYSLEITMSGATVTADVPANTAADPAGNNNTAASQWTIAFDNVAPTISSITSSTTNGSYKSGDSINITVTFSENISVTGTPQITLETGTTDAVVNYASTSGPSLSFTYTVAAGNTSSDLELATTSALALNSGTIKDAAGNNATLTTPITGTNSLSGQKSLIIDTTIPTVTYTSISPATTGRTQTPSITLSLSEQTKSGGLKLYSNSGCSAAISSTFTGAEGSNTITTSSLTAESTTQIYAKATDVALNNSNCTSLVTYTHDTVAPGAPTALTLNASSGQISLSWSAATGEPSAYMVVRCTAACTAAPIAGTAYSASSTLGNGTVLSVASGTSYNSVDLTNGTTYHYAVFAQDEAVNWSASATGFSTPTAASNAGGNTADRFIFLTSSLHSGSELGPNGVAELSATAKADNECHTRGTGGSQSNAKLANNWSWNALLGTGSYTPRTRLGLPSSVNYKNISNTTVATSEAQLFNDSGVNLSSQINLNEDGTTSTNTSPWTGGLAGNNCVNWSSSIAGETGTVGISTSVSSTWHHEDYLTCNTTHPIYCINTPPAYIFVTSTTHNGDLSAEGGPDAYCTTLATASTSITKNLGVTRWRAVTPGDGNPGLSPRAKLSLPKNLKVFLSDGTTLVAASENQLFNDNGNLSNIINKDENGALMNNQDLWMGTTADGCGQSTFGITQYFKSSLSSKLGGYSNNSVINSAWWNPSGNTECNNAHRFICIGQ